MSKKFYTSDLHIGHKAIHNECATVEVPEICKRLHDDGYVGGCNTMQNKSVREILKESGCNCKNCKSSSIGYSKYYNGDTLFCDITLDNCHDSTHGDYLCLDYIPKSELMNISATNLSHIGKWVVFTQEGMNYLLHGRIVSIQDGCYCIKCKNSGYRYAMLDNIITITDSKQKCYSIKGEIKM